MNEFNMNGAFGGGNTQHHPAPPPSRSSRRTWSSLSTEQWIDIVCCSIICWQSLTDVLFYNFLLPVINVGGIVLFIIAVIVIPGADLGKRRR